jgi:hypothetical protein
MILLPHVNDPEWKARREILWQARFNDYYESDDKQAVAYHKKFFFDGDIDYYLNSLPLVRFEEVFENFPAETLTEVQSLTTAYWSYAHSSSNKTYLHFDQSTIDNNFLEVLSRVLGPTINLNAELSEDIFHWAFGDIFEPVRILDIGLDEWRPTLNIDPYIMCSNMRSGYSYYLFDKETHHEFLHYAKLTDYFISVLPSIEPEVFALSYADIKGGNISSRRLQKKQKVVRKFFLEIMGYGRIHKDKITEQRIREALDTLAMPSEYYTFIEFIHKHKQKSIKISE